MFGKRVDGKQIKGVSGFDRVAALILGKTRIEATIYFDIDVPTRYFDEYIEKKRAEGIEYTYRDIVIAALVRVFYLRPRLNRFMMGGRFYQRNSIDVSMAVHKSLRDGANETTVKARFTGLEKASEVKESFNGKIQEAVAGDGKTESFSGGLGWLPVWLFKMTVGFMKLLDRWGLLSDKFLLETSPFHTSIFFADLKSIHLDAVFHHLYNFGNCGFFCTMGKEKQKVIIDEKTGEAKSEKVVTFKISVDERFVDGYYYSLMIKQILRIFENLECLERAPEDDEIKKLPLTPKQAKIKAKQDKKAAKRASLRSQ